MAVNTAEKLMVDMESTGILTTSDMTFYEYAKGLEDFQNLVARMIMKDNYEDGVRLDEVIAIIESSVRKKGISTDPIIRKGINALRTVNKELRITLSGIKGEEIVARTLEFICRPETKVFRNIYLTNGVDETELDAVVVTNEGIIVLEVKKVKNDITITDDGRLIHGGIECYKKKTLGEKMTLKKDLLKEALEKAFDNEKSNIPIFVDSYIVFAKPSKDNINVTDNYHKVKWCFRTGINSRIDNYHGNIMYSDLQHTQICNKLAELEVNKKKFNASIDFDMVRKDFANMITKLELIESNTKEDCYKSIERIEYKKGRQKVNAVSKETIKKNLHKLAQFQIVGSIVSFIVIGGIVAATSNGTVFKR